VSRTVIDIDDSALEAAMRELGTKTKVETPSTRRLRTWVSARNGSHFWTTSLRQRTTSQTPR